MFSRLLFYPSFLLYRQRDWVLCRREVSCKGSLILSPKTAKTDFPSETLCERGLKKQLYQDTFRTPDYFWFDPYNFEFKGFHLADGRYHELQPNEQGRLWSEQLGLFLGVQESTLRFFSPEGQLIPAPTEIAVQTEQERQRADRLAEYLRSQGIDPNTLV